MPKFLKRLLRRPELIYRFPEAPRTALSSATTMPVAMRFDARSARPPKEDLYRIWHEIPGGFKWWHYFSIYEKVIGPLRGKPIRFLEIGVYKGGSLEMWRKYLHPESVIVGLDIDPTCAAFDRPADGLHVRIGDQSDVGFLKSVVEEFGRFDIVLDDGSHFNSHLIKSFDYLFLNGLQDTGIYIAEDTHTNFWPNYRDRGYSFIDLCKDLVDWSHAHYIDHRGVVPFTVGHENRVTEISMSRIGAEIEEIRFLDSIVIIQRNATRPLPTVEHL